MVPDLDTFPIEPLAVPTRDGGSVTLRHPAAPDAAWPSVVVMAPPKSGSVMLDHLVVDVCRTLRMPSYGINADGFGAGYGPHDLEPCAADVFRPRGVVYYGWRAAPPWPLPGVSLLMVRDPRDMLVSAYYSWGVSHEIPAAGPQHDALTEVRERTRAQTVDEFCVAQVGLCLGPLQGFLARQPEVYRYEDVLYDKRPIIRRLAALAETPITDDQVEAIHSRNTILPATENPAAHLRQALPGDHRRKLQPETIETLNGLLHPYFTAFGYEP